MKLFDKLFKHKELGWKEIGEEFRRWAVLKTPWFNVYLHRLYCPIYHEQCHDHPWSFITIILWNGYMELVGDRYYRRRAGSIWYREAEFAHNVITPYGTAWSLVITTNKKREWRFLRCGTDR